MEEWKPVEGFENYLVSNLGRVCRLVVPTASSEDGRLRVNLSKGNKKKGFLLHRLVAKAFVPNPLNLPEVNHLGELSDCRAEKLEWRTGKGNMLYGLKHGQFGGENPGVFFDSRRGHWTAEFWHERKRFYVGSFKTQKEAIAARKRIVDSLPEIL